MATKSNLLPSFQDLDSRSILYSLLQQSAKNQCIVRMEESALAGISANALSHTEAETTPNVYNVSGVNMTLLGTFPSFIF